jgi:hypothetical protein
MTELEQAWQELTPFQRQKLTKEWKRKVRKAKRAQTDVNAGAEQNKHRQKAG